MRTRALGAKMWSSRGTRQRAIVAAKLRAPMLLSRRSFVICLLATVLGSACERSRPESSEVPRIVAANAGAVDLVLELAPPTWLAVLPPVAREYSPAVRELGGLLELAPLPPFGVESLMALEPDLVVAHSWQGAQALASLERLGFSVLQLEDPNEPADFAKTLRQLGDALGRRPEAERAVLELEARLDRLRAADVDPAPRALIYANYGGGGTTPGRGTTYDLLLRLAGAKNVAATAGLDGHVPLDHERLLALDPPILVVGTSLDDPTSSPSLEHLRETPELKSLRALREDRVVLVPAPLLHTTSHELVTAAEHLAPLLRAYAEK